MTRTFDVVMQKIKGGATGDPDSMPGFESSKLIPMRWPAEWRNLSALERLSNTCINCLLIEQPDPLRSIVEQAQRNNIRVIHATSELPGITVIKGAWPGAKLSQSGNRDTASSGPTGLPWVDSNGWKVRLAAALNPESSIWIDVTPNDPPRESYQLCVADAAACGGTWIISLDDQLAAGIQGGDVRSVETWKGLIQSVDFFATHNDWPTYSGAAVVGVLSSFSGDNEAFSGEVLNLLSRTTEQYRIIPKDTLSTRSLGGLRAVLCPDSGPPAGNIRKCLLDFVQTGGLLITRSRWDGIPGTFADWDHPRYDGHVLGKGRIAVASSGDDLDPYLMANDTVALVSHRFDLLRFWDAGSVNAYLSKAPDGQRAIVQMVFYAREMNGKMAAGGPENASVRVAGRYRTAQLLTFDKQPTMLGQTNESGVGMLIDADSVELHLPPLSHYAAVELGA
jgi:hypothetical protein